MIKVKALKEAMNLKWSDVCNEFFSFLEKTKLAVRPLIMQGTIIDPDSGKEEEFSIMFLNPLKKKAPTEWAAEQDGFVQVLCNDKVIRVSYMDTASKKVLAYSEFDNKDLVVDSFEKKLSSKETSDYVTLDCPKPKKTFGDKNLIVPEYLSFSSESLY